MSAAPQFFYFDMGNVLLHFDHGIACRQMAAVAGVSADLVRRIVFADPGGLQWRYERGEISTAQFYDDFCSQTATRPDDGDLLHAASAIFALNAQIVPIVAQLRAAGQRLGVLSNTCEAHWQYVTDGRFALLRDFFDVYALSHKIGAMKPDRAVYARAAELAGVPPGRIFFCDDRAENVSAAQQAGFDAVLYTSPADLAQELRRRCVRMNY